MSLLITLGVIGGICILLALYTLGTELIALIIAHTMLFKEKINNYVEAYRSKKNVKKVQKEEKTETIQDVEAE
ncbi:MAG: hypothetical protein RR342_01215 [Bacilli bacterium]|jgi:CHASE1-domain containing sensor protein